MGRNLESRDRQNEPQSRAWVDRANLRFMDIPARRKRFKMVSKILRLLNLKEGLLKAEVPKKILRIVAN
ncbi:hypothetical protein DO97_11150 [Neosynechococcus sphagnicola sy1]|uniref:Uncharacterized protein n=1 Tax=Neosynechococcus sphagnicola sy1 TaxID=1497020 RepID=A0A098TJC2_9CYAN|nr:hypothetical protein DO97_11150 [Neosynechococcus sphagnicola sy1]